MASSYIIFRKHIHRELRKMWTYPPQQVLRDKGILTITKTLLSKTWTFEMVHKNAKRVWGDNSVSKILKHEFLGLDSCYSGKSSTCKLQPWGEGVQAGESLWFTQQLSPGSERDPVYKYKLQRDKDTFFPSLMSIHMSRCTHTHTHVHINTTHKPKINTRKILN